MDEVAIFKIFKLKEKQPFKKKYLQQQERGCPLSSVQEERNKDLSTLGGRGCGGCFRGGGLGGATCTAGGYKTTTPRPNNMYLFSHQKKPNLFHFTTNI